MSLTRRFWHRPRPGPKPRAGRSPPRDADEGADRAQGVRRAPPDLGPDDDRGNALHDQLRTAEQVEPGPDRAEPAVPPVLEPMEPERVEHEPDPERQGGHGQPVVGGVAEVALADGRPEGQGEAQDGEADDGHADPGPDEAEPGRVAAYERLSGCRGHQIVLSWRRWRDARSLAV